MKTSFLAIAAAAALSVATLLPAHAQQEQEGLVNVIVGDVTVQVPVGIAANVCGINAAVLAEQLPGDAECNADASAAAENQQFMRFAERQGKADQIQ